jgi:hypothetical protein
VERLEEGRAIGHSEQFAPLRLDRDAPLGAVVAADIVAASPERLEGRAAA